MREFLHIVCLDAPSPPDYGGAIDMYYKIRALALSGRKIILHYFNYNENRGAAGLEEYCVEIGTYQRSPFIRTFPFNKPFIVSSRINQQLIDRLNRDDHPVLLEGLHCTGIIPHLQKKKRMVIRMHNEESTYYAHLAKSEKDIAKKIYYGVERMLLQRYEEGLDKQLHLACLSQTDAGIFEQKHGFRNVTFLPSFVPWEAVASNVGKGDYCLYHGNMTVAENELAAGWLIDEVFSKTAIPFIIAGKNVSESLYAKASKFKHVSIVTSPSHTQMQELVANAHINVLPSMNSTGVKLKLLNALFNGRHCVTNAKGIEGSGIDSGFFTAEQSVQWITVINDLMSRPFTRQNAAARQSLLHVYNNAKNAGLLNALL